MQLYRSVLATSWRKVIHTKVLWLFGLFAAILFGATGEIDRYFQSVLRITEPVTQPTLPLSEITTSVVGVFIVVAATILVVCLAILSSLAQASLVAAANYRVITIPKLFWAGFPFWPKVLVVNALGWASVGCASWCIQWLVGLLFPTGTEWYQLAVLLVASLVMAPIVFIVYVTLRYAVCAIVSDKADIWRALQKGVNLAVRNWLVNLEVSLALFGIMLAINIGLIIVAIMMVLPFFAAFYGNSAGINGDGNFIYITLLLAGMIYTVLLICSTGLLSAWQWLAWTNLYKRISQRSPSSWLLRKLL